MKKLEEMTIEEKVGQLVVAGFAGERLTDEDKAHFKKYHIGNYIYFTRNVLNKQSILALSQELHELCLEEHQIAPFITVDQEGGMVTRLFDGATFMPGNMAIASLNDPHLTYTQGSYMAQELLNLGINF
ncbi:MAG: glycoside hydrolase family 3 N-terminal domain-containing protein, partial [Turicibacter sp.]